MTLGLAVTLTGTDNETAELAITGANAPGTVKYTADWTAGVDSWAGGTTGSHSAPTPTQFLGQLLTTPIAYSDQYAKRTVTGLTVGHRYRIVTQVQAEWTGALVYLEVAAVDAGDPIAIPQNTGLSTIRTVTHEFVATATSHDVRLRRADEGGDLHAFAGLTMWNLTVTDIPTTGIGVTVQRTDANGTHFVRQLADAVPDGTGALTIEDEEFALTGSVTWTVRDASGTLASDSIVQPGTGRPLVSAVGFLGTVQGIDRVDGYDEAWDFGEAKTTLAVVGREDPLVTDRTDFAWSLRSGRLTYFLEDYTSARALVDLYRNGRVALLRQPTHPGLDLYHVSRRISPRPYILKAAGWTWQVEVEYQEVAWPDGELRGSFGWSYADVLASYLAYYNLPLAFAQYLDLKAGP